MGQRVVASGCAADAHAEARPQPHEHGAHHRRQQRILSDARPDGRKTFVHGVGQGEAQGGNGGIGDEGLAKKTPAHEIAGGVQHRAGDGGTDVKPVIQKESQPQHAALGNPGEGVHVVQAEGQKGAGEKGDEQFFRERDFTRFRSKIKPRFRKIL